MALKKYTCIHKQFTKGLQMHFADFSLPSSLQKLQGVLNTGMHTFNHIVNLNFALRFRVQKVDTSQITRPPVRI